MEDCDQPQMGWDGRLQDKKEDGAAVKPLRFAAALSSWSKELSQNNLGTVAK